MGTPSKSAQIRSIQHGPTRQAGLFSHTASGTNHQHKEEAAMATHYLDFKFNCDNIWPNGSADLNNPMMLTHSSSSDQVALYFDGAYFSLAGDIKQDLIPVNVGDTVQISSSNQIASEGDYDCVVVRFIAMRFGPDTSESDLKDLSPGEMTSTSAPIADVAFDDPLNQSRPVLDFKDPQPETWEPAGGVTDDGGGAMKTRDVSIVPGTVRGPYIYFDTQNPGVLQFRVVVAIPNQNKGPQYYSFDPYMKIS